ncbi:hypothetical protein UPYG_G00097230 [Umbra pygmaea]|uniref:Uncharacterized protein n=1 Tax=Umbra pygmaea TaxID=75934 RepID=A0ABD0XFZ5_UMBPY
MQSVCHCCDWVRNHYPILSREYLNLLDEMGGGITKLDVPVPFPVEMYRVIDKAEFQDRVRFLNQTIYEITKLFDEDTNSVTWDKKKLDNFQNILYRQFINLKTCVPPAIKPEEKLKSHFQELNLNILKKNGEFILRGRLV